MESIQKIEQPPKLSIEQKERAFADLLLQARDKLGKSRAQIAKDSGIPEDTLESWENFIMVPKATSDFKKRILPISNAYGIPDIEHLVATWKLSLEARDHRSDVRKHPGSRNTPIKKDPDSDVFQGSGRTIRHSRHTPNS